MVEYLPAQPGVLDLGSPRKIPDLDSPKEHHALTLPPPSVQTVDEPSEVVIGIDNMVVDPIGEKFETEETKEQEKEEFVISLDELSNVDFSAMKPEEQRKPKREVDLPKVNYRIEFRSSLNSDRDLDEQQSMYTDNDEIDTFDGSVKDKCLELSFSPNSEGEAEHVLEEKSISMIALPAERTPVKKTPSVDENSTDTNEMNSDSSVSVEASPRSDDSTNLMQAQYEQLQQQFGMWQNQLLQNQTLLANSDNTDVTPNSIGQDDQSNLQLKQLQIQIQMQQQMMFQLQQSMQTIALQNTLVTPQLTPRTQVMTPRVEPVPTPPPAPAPPQAGPPQAPEPPVTKATNSQVATSKPKPSKADAKYTKPKQKRFERQLDPREQLMLAIRGFGKTGLHKVRFLTPCCSFYLNVCMYLLYL